jgi:hypothetical protein
LKRLQKVAQFSLYTIVFKKLIDMQIQIELTFGEQDCRVIDNEEVNDSDE